MEQSSVPPEMPAPAAASEEAAAPMTKSALKRQRRQEAWQANKLARRAAEKDKRKQKQQQIRDLVQRGVIEKPTDTPSHRKKQKQKELAKDKVPHPARICIDLDFDKLMSDKEIKSMASQLAYCYSANRLGSHPFPLLITSFTGRIRQAYENRSDWKSWKGVEWWEESLEELYRGVQPEEEEGPVPSTSSSSSTGGAGAEQATPMTAIQAETEGEAAAPTMPVEPTDGAPSVQTPEDSSSNPAQAPPIALGALSGQPRSRAPQSTIVYLTGDSPNILHSLEPNHTYILGGIVDRNRYKLLCLDKAERLGIRHAQLPIGEALPELKTRKVLTVNQVLDILVKWVDGGEKVGKDGWEGALRSVMPSRKFDAEGKKKRREARARNGGAVGDEDDEEEDGEQSEEEAGDVYIARDDDDDEGDDHDADVGGDEGVREGEATAAPAEAASGPNPDATGQA
ncbi:tRNA (guanine(9)-N(1))-methyltransferase [Rhodotorula mucilaginosa]|uniref:tRNA (guanine(9)-N1)-methyltransferase n=1 Tax=Rhodotorula mucilaginosa TaxID=5537 RepID=A0A9P7B6S2_RHOMI|nr:tRNA (guanine(9)-N(1))-methyltransferase [Rhodotorula mucilaginosa]